MDDIDALHRGQVVRHATVVRPRAAHSSAACTSASLSESRLLVTSSSSSTAGSRTPRRRFSRMVPA